MIDSLEKENEEALREATEAIERARACLEQLEEIALKPDPLRTDYIDLLIQDEKRYAKQGHLGRIKQLESIKQEALLLKTIKENRDIIGKAGQPAE